jgi:hypothetical protein
MWGSFNTKKDEILATKLKDFLVTVACLEVEVEEFRGKLAKNKNFEPISAFKYISRGCSNLTHKDIHLVFE